MGHLLVLRVAPVAYPRSPQGLRPTLLRRPRYTPRAGRKLNSPAGGDIVLSTSATAQVATRKQCGRIAAITQQSHVVECCIFRMPRMLGAVRSTHARASAICHFARECRQTQSWLENVSHYLHFCAAECIRWLERVAQMFVVWGGKSTWSHLMRTKLQLLWSGKIAIFSVLCAAREIIFALQLILPE